MTTLRYVKDGLGRAWDSLAEGWQHLREHAASALTKFNPVKHTAEVETADEQIMRGATRWGLLAAEVREGRDEVVVRLEAPGMEPDTLNIFVADHYLVVRGEKRVERTSQQGRYQVKECAYGSFERAVPLAGEVDDSAAKASYERGVLRVTLPKLRKPGARRIEVKAA